MDKKMMPHRIVARSATAAALLAAGAARAAGDSGTSSMGEMQLTGTHLAILVAALFGLGVVFWLLAKVMNR
jgi:hypothetical protein